MQHVVCLKILLSLVHLSLKINCKPLKLNFNNFHHELDWKYIQQTNISYQTFPIQKWKFSLFRAHRPSLMFSRAVHCFYVKKRSCYLLSLALNSPSAPCAPECWDDGISHHTRLLDTFTVSFFHFKDFKSFPLFLIKLYLWIMTVNCLSLH